MKKLIILFFLLTTPLAYPIGIEKAIGSFGNREDLQNRPKEAASFFGTLEIGTSLGLSYETRIGLFPFEEIENPVIDYNYYNRLNYLYPIKLHKKLAITLEADSDYHYYYDDHNNSFLRASAFPGLRWNVGFLGLDEMSLKTGATQEQYSDFGKTVLQSSLNLGTEKIHFTSSKHQFYKISVNSNIKLDVDRENKYNFYQIWGSISSELNLAEGFGFYMSYQASHFINAWETQYYPRTKKIIALRNIFKQGHFQIQFMEMNTYKPGKMEKEYFTDLSFYIRFK